MHMLLPNVGVTLVTDEDPSSGTILDAPPFIFGVQTTNASLWFHLSSAPADWLKVGSGSGGGGVAVQSFVRTITASDLDKSEISVQLLHSIPGSAYVVVSNCQGVVAIVGADISSRTETEFVMSTTGDLKEGDQIGFIVVPITG